MAYYLLPGKQICKPGLPGNKIEAKTTARPISAEELDVIKESVEFLVYSKVISTEYPAEPEAGTGTTKSDKRIALESQAAALGITFTDETKNKDLAALIEAKKTRAELEAQATELKIEFTAETTDDDLKNKIEEALS